MMRSFFVSIGKAACYVLLFLGVQVLVSSFGLYYLAMEKLMQTGDFSALTDPKALTDLLYSLQSGLLSMQNLLYLITAVLTLGVLILFFRLRKKRLLREVWAMPIQIKSLWPVVLLGVAFSLLTCYVVGYIPWPEGAIAQYEQLYSYTNDRTVLALIATVIAAPILEEIIFRGLVFTRLCGGMPAIPAAILASTVFAAMHGVFIWAAYAFVGSMMLLFVYTKYRSLYASILFHMLFNLTGGYLITYIPNLGTAFDIGLTAASLAASAALVYVIVRMPREKIDKTLQPE